MVTLTLVLGSNAINNSVLLPNIQYDDSINRNSHSQNWPVSSYCCYYSIFKLQDKRNVRLDERKREKKMMKRLLMRKRETNNSKSKFSPYILSLRFALPYCFRNSLCCKKREITLKKLRLTSNLGLELNRIEKQCFLNEKK